MAEKFTNLVSCTLASSITAVSTTIALKSGDGAKLPSIPNGTANVFRLVLTDKSGNTEIISICRREAGSDTLYVGTGTSHQATGNVAGRGMESTSALAITYTDSHVIELGWTAAQADAALEYTTLGKLTAAGAALLDDADANAQLTTLGGTAAGTALFKAATAAAQVTALGFTATSTEMNATDRTGRTTGDLIVNGASAWEYIAAVAAGQYLKSAGVATKPAYGKLSLSDTGIKVGTIDCTAHPSSKAVTGVGFAPSAVLFIAYDYTNHTGASIGFDACDGSTFHSILTYNNASYTPVSYWGGGSKPICIINGSSMTQGYISATGSDGFTLTFDRHEIGAYIYYLALP